MKNAHHDLAAQLKSLGFKSILPPLMERGDGDFGVFDDSDGRGPYIRYWLSKEPCPFPEFLRGPIEDSPSKEEQAKAKADRIEREANEKERDDMAKAAELIADATKQVDVIQSNATKMIALAEKRTNDALNIAATAIAQRDEAFAKLAAYEAMETVRAD